MSSVSAKPPSGMRDFLPADVVRREHVVRIVKEAYARHGFVPLETPAVERVEALTGKYGDEGDQLMFKILKRGEKLPPLESTTQPSDLTDLALRYDLTVPLARVYACYGGELPRYFKRYQIQPVWRADRPQRGRFREFYQCDVDYVGTRSLLAEVSVIGAVREALVGLGFVDFTIRVNDRRVLAGLMEVAGVASEAQGGVFTAIDKLDKIGVDGVRAELAQRGLGDAQIACLAPLLGEDSDRGDAERLDALDAVFASGSSTGRAGTASLRELFSLLSAEGLTAGKVSFDASLARGLSYYTGTIFEVALEGLASSVGGGGRYDGLIGMFRGDDVPAVGFSLGLERLLVILEDRGMLPALRPGADAMVLWMDAPDTTGFVLDLARQARAAGVRVEVFPEATGLGKQMKYAESIGIRHVAIVGKREAESGRVGLKDLVSGEQTEVAAADLGAALLERVGAR